jgi:hypothetical protein
VRVFFGSPATRARLRIVGIALLAALVATLLTTIGAPGGRPLAAAQDRFSLAVKPDLPHIDGQGRTITVGLEETEQSADSHDPARIDGTAGVSGLVQVHDESGHLAGTAIAPKDTDALFDQAGDGPLDMPVTYESTAFSMFLMQPGLATTDPAVTVFIAALVIDVPEFDALVDVLESDAQDSPAYLEEPSDQVDQALGELVVAFEKRVKELDEELGGDAGEPPTTTTTRLFAPPAAARPIQTDPDQCHVERPAAVIVIDVTREDHVCLTDAEFNGTAWEVSGTSTTPRWAVARPINRGVPAEQLQLIPGKSLSLPSLEALAYDLADAVALGLFDDLVANNAIRICNAGAWIIGKRCADPNRPGVIERFTDMVKGYFADADFSFELTGSESRTVLSINGIGTEGGDASGSDLASSVLATFVMDVVMPGIGIFIDSREVHQEELATNDAARRALIDTAATLAPSIATFLEDIGTGSLTDKLGKVVDLASQTIRATIDSGLLLILLREFFFGAGEQAVATALQSLADNIAKAPVKWIDLGIDVVNAGVTLLMLVDDVFELSTSARYGLGYERAPEDGPAVVSDPGAPILSEPLENPALPGESCGLRVALVLDRSGSIRDAGDDAIAQVRGAAVGLIDALGTTPSSVRISAFGTWPSTRIGWTSLADAEGRRATRQAANGVNFAHTGDASGSTNWEAALTDVLGQGADIAVLVTDGNPTKFGNAVESSSPPGGSFDFDPTALAAGVDAANTLKLNGTRVVAVGVGEVNVDPLRQVSGPTEGTDYFLGDFASLGTALTSVATELCGGGLVVRHLVDGIPTGGAEYTFEVPGRDAETLVTAADGSTRLSLQESAEAVTVRGPTGLPLDDITCEQGGQPVDARVDEVAREAAVDLDGVVTCTFSWRALTGPDAALAEIFQGPGRVEVVTFEPRPAAGGAVVGCLSRGRRFSFSTPTCDVGEFGVSWTAGFAVFRYDDTCPHCDPLALDVTSDAAGAVRLQLDESRLSGGSLGLGLGAMDLDLTATHPGEAQQPGLSGSVNGGFYLDVTLRQPPGPDVCLARQSPSTLIVLPRNDPITTGAGC